MLPRTNEFVRLDVTILLLNFDNILGWGLTIPLIGLIMDVRCRLRTERNLNIKL